MRKVSIKILIISYLMSEISLYSTKILIMIPKLWPVLSYKDLYVKSFGPYYLLWTHKSWNYYSNVSKMLHISFTWSKNFKLN